MSLYFFLLNTFLVNEVAFFQLFDGISLFGIHFKLNFLYDLFLIYFLYDLFILNNLYSYYFKNISNYLYFYYLFKSKILN